MQQTNRRNRDLLITLFPSESQALKGYRLLQQGGVSPEHVAIVGQGYLSCDAVGFAQPLELIKQRAYKTALFAGCVGSLMGLAFLAATGIQVFPGNWVLNILLAMTTAGLSGLVGGFLVGGGAGLLYESSESIGYRNKVARGKYLILVEGNDALVAQAAELLKNSSAESTRRYYFRPVA